MSKMKHIPILTLALAAMAVAQTATPAAPATKTAPAAKPGAPAAAQAPAKPAQGSVGSGIKNKVEEEKAKVEALLSNKKKPEEKKSTQTKDTVDNSKSVASTGKRRDPFVNPITLVVVGPEKIPCTKQGPVCLSPDQMFLKGIIKTPSGMIAMVENPAKKEYNLREKDLIKDGYVYKITTDTIIFRISVTNLMNQPVQQDVVKRVTPPAI